MQATIVNYKVKQLVLSLKMKSKMKFRYTVFIRWHFFSQFDPHTSLRKFVTFQSTFLPNMSKISLYVTVAYKLSIMTNLKIYKLKMLCSLKFRHCLFFHRGFNVIDRSIILWLSVVLTAEKTSYFIYVHWHLFTQFGSFLKTHFYATNCFKMRLTFSFR